MNKYYAEREGNNIIYFFDGFNPPFLDKYFIFNGDTDPLEEEAFSSGIIRIKKDYESFLDEDKKLKEGCSLRDVLDFNNEYEQFVQQKLKEEAILNLNKNLESVISRFVIKDTSGEELVLDLNAIISLLISAVSKIEVLIPFPPAGGSGVKPYVVKTYSSTQAVSALKDILTKRNSAVKKYLNDIAGIK